MGNAAGPYSADAARLTEAFELAPDLSGVLYCSRNHVVSEALFDRANAAKAHLTDRTVASEVIQRLPAARDLTFSFPGRMCSTASPTVGGSSGSNAGASWTTPDAELPST